MRFITLEGTAWRLERYLQYLKANALALPEGARAFATAPWHYDISDHRCPHDSWLEDFTVREAGTGPREEDRSVAIAALFKGAFHDGWLSLSYDGVSDYALETRASKHGDWLVDEIIEDGGEVIHEIAFENARWAIHCRDLTAVWYREKPAR